MPITEGLKNIQKLESVGFDHKQAEALADIIEQAQTKGYEGLKEFIHSEITGLDNKIESLANKVDVKIESLNNKVDVKIESINSKIDDRNVSLSNELKAEIAISSKDLLVKIFGIIVGTIGIAVAILKLFP